MKGPLAVWVAGALGLTGLLGCTATPDLAYSLDDATAPIDGRAADGALLPDGAPADGTVPGSDGSSPDAGALEGGFDAPADAGGDTAQSACQPFDSGPPLGVGCCANAGRLCVKESCQHCGDCVAANCSAGEFCCPNLAGRNYKGTFCFGSPTCH